MAAIEMSHPFFFGEIPDYVITDPNEQSWMPGKLWVPDKTKPPATVKDGKWIYVFQRAGTTTRLYQEIRVRATLEVLSGSVARTSARKTAAREAREPRERHTPQFLQRPPAPQRAGAALNDDDDFED